MYSSICIRYKYNPYGVVVGANYVVTKITCLNCLNLVPNTYLIPTLLAKQLGRFSFRTKMYLEIISFEIFKRPKYLQHSIKFLKSFKAASFLYEANIVEAVIEIRNGLIECFVSVYL